MSDLSEETRDTAQRLLDLISVYQDTDGVNPAALATAVNALGRAEDEEGRGWLPEAFLPASQLLVRVLILRLAHEIDADPDEVLVSLREWVNDTEIT